MKLKKKANDEAKLQDQINLKNKKPLKEQEQVRVEKNTLELETEAENINLRNTQHQRQLDVKDEDLKETGILEDRAEIQKIDKSIKNKTKIRDAIEAGTNCTKRNT